ncbi:HNH endonuclease [Chromobacterium haemolyticum]|nr:HNH endonuclease [Chromobacterium haemolyticum]
MKKINPPGFDAEYVLNLCLSGIGRVGLKSRFEHYKGEVVIGSGTYVEKAGLGELFTIPAINGGRGEDPVVLGDLKRSEFVKLYELYLLDKEKKPARFIYEELLLSSERCPFCGGIGFSSNLDHYLPKKFFPQFSVLPLNLLPACRDCNMGEKGATFAQHASEQILHPYLDGDRFFNEQWVGAEVTFGDPCIVSFFVSPPDGWSQVDKDRVRKHFSDFNLAKRYRIQAAEELSIIVDMRKKYMSELSPDSFRQHLIVLLMPPCL